MRSFEERPEPVDDASIDRLVDGELPERGRRGLLLRLEQEPDGWRRCALAFLEDQAWRKAFESAAPAEPAASRIPALASPAPLRKGSSIRISIAATILASTFAAGFASGGLLKTMPRADVAQSEAPEPPAMPDVPGSGVVRQVGTIQFFDARGRESFEPFPILSGPGLDDQWLLDQPPSVPDYLRARWERRGYQVEEHRKLVSVELKDGRHVSIPVDEVEVDYIGQQPL